MHLAFCNAVHQPSALNVKIINSTDKMTFDFKPTITLLPFIGGVFLRLVGWIELKSGNDKLLR